jgi:hypothetical protein
MFLRKIRWDQVLPALLGAMGLAMLLTGCPNGGGDGGGGY